MEVTSKEQKRAEQLLQSQHIGLHQIKSFSFMKRYHQVPRKSNLAAKDKYGPGILTLHLKEGKEKVNLSASFPSPFLGHPLPGLPRNPLRQLRTEGTDSRRGSHRNIPASVTLYVLVLCLIPDIPYIGILFHQWQRMVGLHPGYHFVCIKSFFHQHADDPLLLPDVGQ